MMVGVNGTGKTTTSGKLAALYGTHGRRALLCAADTFRAAAIEQLEVWAKRSNVDIIKTKQGGDPSAALYDSLTAGKARGVDIVIVDTAGRLHNKSGLMAELDKMRRTAAKLVPGAPHQVFLVIDATTGQNGMQQARLFTESAGVTGIVLCTKLDGTAKGGIVIAIARELKLPVVFAGVGEKMEDIVPFDSDAFLDSLLSVRSFRFGSQPIFMYFTSALSYRARAGRLQCPASCRNLPFYLRAAAPQGNSRFLHSALLRSKGQLRRGKLPNDQPEEPRFCPSNARAENTSPPAVRLTCCPPPRMREQTLKHCPGDRHGSERDQRVCRRP